MINYIIDRNIPSCLRDIND